MTNQNKLIRFCLHLALSLSSLLTFGFTQAYAVDITSDVCKVAENRPAVCSDATGATTSNPLLGPDGIVTKGLQIFLVVIGIITLFVMLINAVRMITSNGNSDSMNKARDGVIYTAIGLAIILLAQGIVLTVIKRI